MLNNVSYRYKIPATLIAVIVVTALGISVPLISGATEAAKRDLIEHALSLGRTLSRTLQPAMLHDELWQAYEIIRTPFDRAAEGTPEKQTILVLDGKGDIYISTDPERFRTTEPLSAIGPLGAKLAAALANQNDEPLVLENLDPTLTIMAIPVLAVDKSKLGTVVMEYSNDIFEPRLLATIRRAALSTALVLLILVPLGWLWGQRIANPLLRLASAIGQVPKTPAASITFAPPQGQDEIGVLGRRFQQMLEGLKEKATLERKVVASERLAAVGRLTAGIAHEINNPLGGMLNAISNYRRQGGGAAAMGRTIALLERGLTQIKDTVSSLLVEARLASNALAPDDVEDVRTLVMPDVERKGVSLDWRNELTENQTVPSTEVRQILLNLLLNGVEGANPSGNVRCRVVVSADEIQLEVENDGPGLSSKQREHLFEPFAESRTQGKGLGLWMTYQLVTQLRGRIEARSRPGQTVFSVTLPVT
jgi:two-component system, NtrC family, sensor kinase